MDGTLLFKTGGPLKLGLLIDVHFPVDNESDPQYTLLGIVETGHFDGARDRHSQLPFLEPVDIQAIWRRWLDSEACTEKL